MAVGLPLKTTYANGDVYSASDVNDTNGTINLFQTSTLSNQAGKNYLINGGFDIWQRGTSFTPSSTAYGADRWTYNNNSAMTISRQTSGLTGFTYALRMQRNSGSTSTTQVIVAQSIESSQALSLAGKTATISFYVRCGATYASGTAYGYVYTGTGTDQNLLVGYTGAANPFTATFTPTTTWTRVTATGTISSSATEVALQINFNPTGTAGATDFLEIAGVQLELGSYATTFSRAGGTIQGELAACQRYYYRTQAGPVYAAAGSWGVLYNTTSVRAFTYLKTSMRIAPTSADFSNMAIYDPIAGGLGAITSVSLDTGLSTVDAAYYIASGSTGFTANRTAYIISNNISTGYIGFSAEL
jgi:hypothetical protein